MSDSTKGVVLVGHGGIPKDYPGDLVTKLKRLEAQRRAAGVPMSHEEYELDQKIRQWPRTPDTDPYQAGLELLAASLQPLLHGARFSTAYNEFCTPTLSEAIEQQIADGANDITVISTMFTPAARTRNTKFPRKWPNFGRNIPMSR